GASRGIGAAIARRLAAEGFAVALNYASNNAEADALVAELTRGGASAIAIQADVSQADQASAMFTTVEQRLGRIDVLVNNAGVLKTAPLAQTSDAQYLQHFAINTQG
ncbi:SDR family NAD(P)-dependent oxidoreductase, partial [Mycobacterium tuberculosis]